MSTPSTTGAVFLGMTIRGLPARLDTTGAPASSNSVISRNSRNSRT